MSSIELSPVDFYSSFWAFERIKKVLEIISKCRGLDDVIDNDTVIDNDYLVKVWIHIHTPDKYEYEERKLLREALWTRVFDDPEKSEFFQALEISEGFGTICCSRV